MLPSHFSLLNLGIFACVVIFALLLILFVLIDFNAKTRSSSLPGIDSTDPDKGNFEDIQDAGSLHQFLVNLHEEYGPLASFWWGPKLVVSFASPELFNEVKNVFDRPTLLYEALSGLIGKKSMRYTNGAAGRKRRQVIDEVFTHNAVAHYYDQLRKVANEVGDKWASLPADQHIALSQYMLAMTMKAIALSTFGQEMNDEKILKLRKANQACWDEILLQLKGSMPEDGDERDEKFNTNRVYMRDVSKEAIKRRRAQKNKEDHIFLDSLLNADFIDEEELIDQAITILVESFLPTGNLMTWCLYFLATHQDIQERLYDEMVTILGEDSISPQNIPELTYTRKVIDETMRCSVVALWSSRITDYDLQIGEHFIPKETPIILELGVVMKDENIWPDPDRFDPERFSPENSKGRHPMAFQPFGFAGKRKCPGYRFAYAEIFVLLSVLVRRFKINLVEGQVIEPDYAFHTTPSDEIWVTITPR